MGPFRSLEQAVVPQTPIDGERTAAFVAYNIVGSGAGALGALAAGLPSVLGLALLPGFRILIGAYAAAGVLLFLLATWLAPAVEGPSQPHTARRPRFGLRRWRGVVLKLGPLFALNSRASDLMVQSIVTHWFHLRSGVAVAGLGAIFFGSNLIAAFSFLAAPAIAQWIGLLRAMVFIHLPGNALVLLVPLMPSLELAIVAWLARYVFAQMERPPRQSYAMAIIAADERAAASGLMEVARTVSAAIAPGIAGATLAVSALGLPFPLAGGLKIAYDLTLPFVFRRVWEAKRAGLFAGPVIAARAALPSTGLGVGRSLW